MKQSTVVIDALPESANRYGKDYAVVAIDVIRSTTTAITAVSSGRRCFPAPSLEAAFALARRLPNPLLAGELHGRMPEGFELNNSPAQLVGRADIARALILLSTSGTQLVCNARNATAVYLACFRNYTATARHLIRRQYLRVAVLGAGSRGEFREEDQMCCAWVAGILFQAGYLPQDRQTARMVERWAGCPPGVCRNSESGKYLRRTQQVADLDFILERIDDLDAAFVLSSGEEILMIPSTGDLTPMARLGVSGALHDSDT